MMNGETPTINGDGKQSRDFTYIENVIEANLKACLASHEAAGQAYNIAYGGREYLIEKEMTCSDILDYAPAWCSVVIQVLRTGKYSQGTVLNEAMKMDQYQSPYHSVPDACWEKALAHYDIPLLTRN